MRNIDPSSMDGIVLTALSYGAGVSFLLLLSQVLLTPYYWTIIYREYGIRIFLWPHEALALRRKHPLFRFVWNASIALAFILLLSLFGMGAIYARHSV